MNASYDPLAVRFYDIAHEGAQLRALAQAVERGLLETLYASNPRSIIVLCGERTSRLAAHVMQEWYGTLALPIVLATQLPQYVGPLDVVLVLSEEPANENLAQAISTAHGRGATVILLSGAAGALMHDAPQGTLIVDPLPMVEGPSLMRPAGALYAVIESLTQEPSLVAASLERCAEAVDAELQQCSPERDECVNPARQLALRSGVLVHSGAIEVPQRALSDAIALLVAHLWTLHGRPGAAIDATSAYDVFRRLQGNPPQHPVQHMVWGGTHTDSVPQDAHLTGLHDLNTVLRLLTRAFAATVFFDEDSTSSV